MKIHEMGTYGTPAVLPIPWSMDMLQPYQYFVSCGYMLEASSYLLHVYSKHHKATRCRAERKSHDRVTTVLALGLIGGFSKLRARKGLSILETLVGKDT